MRKLLTTGLLAAAALAGCMPMQTNKFCRVIGWPAGKMPRAPAGFHVQEFARDLATFLTGLNQPYGMAIAGDQFLVANTNGIFAYPYKLGELAPSGPGRRLIALPAGGYNNHWTRNLLVDEAHQKLYVSVGSASNIGEHGMQEEYRRANIL